MRTANTLGPDAVIYTRISKDSGATGEAVERQEYDCRKLAERLGLNITAVYPENDTGASQLSRKPRPVYAQMLEDVRAGKVKVILAYSNSRLTRRPREWLELIELAGKPTYLQVRTVVSGDHDLSTADGRAVAMTVAIWDAAEAERIGEEARRHMKRRPAKASRLSRACVRSAGRRTA